MRLRIFALLGLVAALVAGDLVVLTSSSKVVPAATACPKRGAADAGAKPGAKRDSRLKGPLAARPPVPEVNPACGTRPDAVSAANFDAALATRLGASPDGYAAAIEARQRLAAKAPVVPGGRSRWQPAATGPLVADNPKYPLSASSGYSNLAGRVSSFAVDPAGNRLYAAASQGGVWLSGDQGQSWRSIGEGLPTQIVGAVGYSPAQQDGSGAARSGEPGRRARGKPEGTVIAATGDNAFGAYTYGGVGIYTSTDNGRKWVRARGIPNGALSFRVAVDPTNPNVVYAATGLGLYRSSDGARSFVNVALPTGRCAGNSLQADCFLANVVTDVVVQAPDHFGHGGGAVLAAVGWRAGAHPNQSGSPESPSNGLYASASGLPGSFRRLAAPGYAQQSRIGRTALGVATGAEQNHGYVYAEVQDALLFNTGKLEGLDIPSLPDPIGIGLDPTKTPTVLNGVYVSSDFGKTWHLMADRLSFLLPGNGSKQTGDPGFELLGAYGPGIQAWFNEWIHPDPTRQVGGVPTRVLLGLEEVWQTSSTTRAANGYETFRALTQYSGDRTPSCVLQLLQTLVCDNLARPPTQTVHPDQHAAIWLPDSSAGATLLIGNDGGAYRQHVGAGQELTVAGFGSGSQTGFQTLESYAAAMSKDGTIYTSLQDNGLAKITPDKQQNETIGGDGIFTAVDPGNSDIAYDTLPGGNVFVTKDGGKGWRMATPGAITNPPFYTPLAMDPLSPNHLMTGGRQVLDSTSGPETAKSSNGTTIDPATDWKTVFDLGTRQSPGDANAAGSAPADAENQVSAVATRGGAEYAGYCGSCDPVKEHALFGSGIATNVGGGSRPTAGSANGWHVATANGLPHRIVTSIAIDPANARHIFVTLGSSTLRPYVPPGALGNDGVSPTAGSVYESLNAGEGFRNASADLPKIGAAWVAFHRRQLVVANTVGVFASTTKRLSATKFSRLRYGVLGHGLPHVAVFSLAFSPVDADLMVGASFGRGVWTYRFSKR
jgi:hypothetical protein